MCCVFVEQIYNKEVAYAYTRRSLELHQTFCETLQGVWVYSLCTCTDAQRKKLDDKSIKCIFLGVSEESKAYRLYNPVTKRIIISRDVVFMENEKWSWNKDKQITSSRVESSDDEQNEEIHEPVITPEI